MTKTDFDARWLLPNRSGLPAEVAFLRDSYPPADWPAHAHFGELSAFWLQVHESLRREGQTLQQATADFREGRWDVVRFQRFFVPSLNHFLQHLEGHHQIEDRHYFPRFRGLDQRMVFGFDLLENDHEIIHERLLSVVDSARALIAGLAQGPDAARRAADAHADDADRLLMLLEQHLGDEEDLVIPAILEYSEQPLR